MEYISLIYFNLEFDDLVSEIDDFGIDFHSKPPKDGGYPRICYFFRP